MENPTTCAELIPSALSSSRVSGKQLDAVGFNMLVRATVAANIERNHTVVLRKKRHLLFPTPAARSQTMDEQ
jgi:CMP-2-keto-3-deoxyoctulosonic acid synthetase